MLLHHRAAQAQAQAHALGLGGEERREQLARPPRAGCRARSVTDRKLDPALQSWRAAPSTAPGGPPGTSSRWPRSPALSMACMALRARFSSTCSTMVRSHQIPAGRSRAPDAHRQLARLQLTSGMTASISGAGRSTGSRTCSRRRTKSCTLRITRPARCGLLGNALQRLGDQPIGHAWGSPAAC
jgi:hypothetical protein